MDNLERQIHRHKIKVKALNTIAVLGSMVIALTDLDHYAFMSAIVANVLWIWNE